jgi:general secretion pathway protein D
VLTSDEGTNTLIAIGEPRLLAQIETLLRTLDVRQPQVMLDVLMVTLTESQALDLGIELERLTSSGDAQIRLSSLFGLSVRSGGGDLTAPSLGAGFTGVVLSPGEFSVIVRALHTISEGRSLSMPRLLAGNNQQATLDAVVQQPFASVNASNTVSTTSFGGTHDAGTVVSITPRIAEGDHLLLQYAVSLSSFVGAAASATLPPPRQQNRVQSTATIPDGHVVVVGGIEIEDQSRGVSQIPLLGRIPIIGEAFKSRRTASSRSRFFVFIRATILRHPGFEDLKYVSAKEAAASDLDDGWPRTQPRIIR